jgi:amino acid transporter
MAAADLQELDFAAEESAKLQRHFGRFDILFFLICTIVGVDTIATVAQGGGEAFTWMMVFALIFFVPQALLFAELGAAFPQEGGPYLWTRMAFGHLAGAVNNFLYWITNPVWIGGSLTISCIGAVEVFFHHGSTLPTVAWYIVALAFVWISIIAAFMSCSVGKWLPTAGAWARFLLLGLFTLTVIVYAAKHGAHGLGASSYSPSAAGFVALVGVLLFNFVGFELPSSAGEEMTNPQRDVPFAIARSTIGSVLLYALPVIGILIVLPPASITNFSGFVSAIQQVFTVYGGSVAASGAVTLSGLGLILGDACALLFILCLLTSGATWIMGSDRALAVSCYDGSGPRFLGVINAKYGTPVRVNVFSGIVATIVVILAQQITSGNAAKYFDAVLGVTISTTLISYLLIYPALWKLRRSHPDTPRPFRMPLYRVLTVVLMVLVALATVQLIAPGAGYHWFGSDFIPDGWTYSERYKFLLTEALPVLIFICVGVLFYVMGRKTRERAAAVAAARAAAGTEPLAD